MSELRTYSKQNANIINDGKCEFKCDVNKKLFVWCEYLESNKMECYYAFLKLYKICIIVYWKEENYLAWIERNSSKQAFTVHIHNGKIIVYYCLGFPSLFSLSYFFI